MTSPWSLSVCLSVLSQIYLPFYSNMSEERKRQVEVEGEARKVAPGSMYRNMNRRIGQQRQEEGSERE